MIIYRQGKGETDVQGINQNPMAAKEKVEISQ